MMNTVKEIIYTVGGTTGSLAKSFGSTSADLAKTIGTGTVGLARTIGPKRALIGAAILAVAIGGSIVLVRYLRKREEAELEEESMLASDRAGRRDTKLSRAGRAVPAAAPAMR